MAGVVGVASAAAAPPAAASFEPATSASLQAIEADTAHHLLTQDYVARARKALDRGAELRNSGDTTRAEIAEKSAAIWQEAARSLVRAAAAEDRASTVQLDALDAGTRAERERALLEEALATVGRRKAELARMDREKNEAPTRTTQTADVHLSSPAGAGDAGAAAPNVSGGGSRSPGARGMKDAGAEKDWAPSAATAAP